MSIFGGRAAAATIEGPASGPINWSEVKAEITSRLDVAAEYESLGVKFTKSAPDSKGRQECHAIGRPDLGPSAFVNVHSGVYHDAGGECESAHLFAFAVKYGSFGRWYDAAKHYAEKAGVSIGRAETRSGGRILEARYDYADHEGEVRYAVFRYILPNGKKSFSQHPPDGRGGWKFGAGCMDGVSPLPYRLGDMLDEPESTVYVVEGEKAADALADAGRVATTSHGGCGNTDKTWPSLVEHFRNRDVVVLPDNDPGGRAHAAKVCGYLGGVARSLKLLQLPGLAPKGDVHDWLAEGNDPAGLEVLAGALPAWSPGDPATATTEDDPSTRDATVADIRRTLSDEAWLWPAWIPTGALTLLASEPGKGKTRFCFDLHRRLLHGLAWPDGSGPVKVLENPKFLWVCADNQYSEMCEIADTFGIPDELIVVNSFADDPYGGTSLQTAEELADLEARITRVRPTLVVIDTITNTSDAKSQDSSDAKRQYKPLQDIATRTQVPILCVTHLNVGGRVLGRRAEEKARVVIQLAEPDPEGQPNRRKLWVHKSKALKPNPLGITMGTEGNEYDDSPPEKPEEGQDAATPRRGPSATKLKACMDWLSARVNGDGVRVTAIREAADAEGYTAATLYDAKRKLGIVESETESEGRFGKKYKLWSAPAAK